MSGPLSAQHSEVGSPGGKKTTKAGTVAERIVWMTRTSDVLGSHMKTDLESYLTLIRRKIQEKCSTTAELITQIRRFKIGDSGHVTPNEFRFTLIKFGIILQQVLVDRIFNVFDSDRSGTMDFDEFAMWIMNSEFRPAVKDKKFSEKDTPEMQLRQKFQKIMKENPRAFQPTKKHISFLEFVSDVTRLSLPLTEKETRGVFLILDPQDCGFIETALLHHWANTGKTFLEKPKENFRIDLSQKEIREIVNRVVGRNTRQLEDAFAHIQRGEATKLPFEEFRRCLLNGGVGKNMVDIRELFMALGGSTIGLADVDLFFNMLPPILKDPHSDISSKRTATANVNASRADRHLRDSIRKCFKEVKNEIEHQDTEGSGFINAETLYRILVKRCMPLTFQDFRFIIQQIRKEPGTDRIDYKHFLHGYNPSIPPHEFEGISTLRKYSESISADLFNSSSNNNLEVKSTQMGLSSSLKLPLGKLSSKTLSKKETKAQDDIKVGLAKSASYDWTAANNSTLHLENPELRKTWQAVLRECHRSDPERTGQVNRITFISALEKGQVSKVMSIEGMNKLADQYTLSNGLINYLLLFRTYLHDLSRQSSMDSLVHAKSTNSLDISQNITKAHDTGPVHPWEFGYKRERHPDHPYWFNASTFSKELDLANTEELPTNTNKLLNTTAVLPSKFNKDDGTVLVTNNKEKQILLVQYPSNLIQLCQKCFELIAPIWRVLRQQFKKNCLANNPHVKTPGGSNVPVSTNTQKSYITTTQFITVMESHGIALSKKEYGLIVKHFRAIDSAVDAIKFDEFLKVCMLMKED